MRDLPEKLQQYLPTLSADSFLPIEAQKQSFLIALQAFWDFIIQS